MSISRPLLDRAADLRDQPGTLDSLRASDDTAVVVLRDRRARAADGRLVLVAPSEVGDADWALLGRLDDGTVLLVASEHESGEGVESVDALPDESWLSIRESAGLEPLHAEILIQAVALAGWLRDGGFCPRCGSEMELRQGGWARYCTSCARDHFPRTDPAVIVAVESDDGERLLLGANANWQGRMYSCFAGFVEAGESLESTVHRELEEESGVRISALRYISSQPWPFPRSLMVGFRATVADERDARPDGEEIIDVRWFTREEIGAALRGEGPVGLPGAASIARALIVDWYEERV